MPRAAYGTPKDAAMRMKAKGLQKLKWYCQICQKQCRDENGFRNHAQGEGHQKRALEAGKHSAKTIGDFSRQFQSDFVAQLRAAHNEKKIRASRLYNQYIQNKEHIHMNSTRWHTLTEFVKHLGRSGICRVEEDEKEGLMIQWIDNSPEALARADAAKKKERQKRGDEELTLKIIQEQVERAQKSAPEEAKPADDAFTIDLDQASPVVFEAPVLKPKTADSKIRKVNVFAKRAKEKSAK